MTSVSVWRVVLCHETHADHLRDVMVMQMYEAKQLHDCELLKTHKNLCNRRDEVAAMVEKESRNNEVGIFKIEGSLITLRHT